MSLREQVACDNRRIFFDPDEFGRDALVNGVPARIVEDGEQLGRYRAAGLTQGELLIYIEAAVLERLPRCGDRLLIETPGLSRQWYVESCRDEEGILELVLRRGV